MLTTIWPIWNTPVGKFLRNMFATVSAWLEPELGTMLSMNGLAALTYVKFAVKDNVPLRSYASNDGSQNFGIQRKSKDSHACTHETHEIRTGTRARALGRGSDRN